MRASGSGERGGGVIGDFGPLGEDVEESGSGMEICGIASRSKRGVGDVAVAGRIEAAVGWSSRGVLLGVVGGGGGMLVGAEGGGVVLVSGGVRRWEWLGGSR